MTTNNADPQAPARPAAGVEDKEVEQRLARFTLEHGLDGAQHHALKSLVADLLPAPQLPAGGAGVDREAVQRARDLYDDGDGPYAGALDTTDRLARYYLAVRDALDAALAAPAPEPVDRQGPVFGIRPEVLLRECLKPDEISGDRREARVAELLSWFSRFADGYANPKWLRGHAFELAYVLAASAPAPSPVGKSLVRRNAERDPDYRPYCMRCPGLVRMRKVEDFYWRCRCGAEHDERTTAPDADGAAGVVISDGEVGRALHAALHALVSRAWERQDHAGEYDRVLALFGTLLLDADDVARLRDRRRHPTLAEPTR